LVTNAEFPFSTSITIASQPAGYKVENCSFSDSIGGSYSAFVIGYLIMLEFLSYCMGNSPVHFVITI
jgi:hypothetical protein